MFTKTLISVAIVIVAISTAANAAQRQPLARGLVGNPHTIGACGPTATWDAYGLRCDGGN
jgi:hypothetical protein